MKANQFINSEKGQAEAIGTILVIFVIVVLIGGALLGYPIYKVWAKEKAGQASLAEAEWDKQIAVEEAKALKDSAQYQAEAELLRQLED